MNLSSAATPPRAKSCLPASCSVLNTYTSPRVFLDVSSIPPAAVLRYFPRLLEVADKVLYGSDWPSPGVRSMADNLQAFRRLPLPPEALEKILDGNARRVVPAP